MIAIGGYFGLELNDHQEYHPDAIKLNTGRNALEYLLLVNNYKKIHIPYFTCDAVLEPIKKLNLNYEFYSVDENLEPLFDYRNLTCDASFLYTNYFGLKDAFVLKLSEFCPNLIIDNAQSFFSRPQGDVDTFYSPRKFFGVSDGAYLYSKNRLKTEIPRDSSAERYAHLLERVDYGAEKGYLSYVKNEKSLGSLPMKKMSHLTEGVLKSINYERVIATRLANYSYLREELQAVNQLEFNKKDFRVPMVYPFLSNNKDLYEKLIENKIFVAKYWPNVKEWAPKESLEVYLAENVISLPIDQRYDKEDMKRIVNLIKL